MRYIIKYIALFFCYSLFAQTITAPQISCVSVLPNGNIAITWQTPADPLNEFASYQIYISQTKNNPTYTLQIPPVTNYSTNSYTINTNDANTHTYYIYMQTTTTGSNTVKQVDTVKTLHLKVSGGVNNIGAPGVATLNWAGFYLPLSPGDDSYYSIYKDTMGVWYKIDSIPVNTDGDINYVFSDTITECNAYILYKIELTNSFGCTSVSDTSGGWFQNKNKPSAPMIDSISVVTTPSGNEEVIMGISSAYSKDVMCFMMWAVAGSNNTNLGVSICNFNKDTSYTYTGASPTDGSITLTTTSKDICGNISQFPLNVQSTIYTNVYYDPCEKKNIINWTPYVNMVTGVKDYEIYYSVSGPQSNFIRLGDTTATVYYQKGVLPGTTYWYFVRAHSKGKTITGKDTASSTSNTFPCQTANPPKSKYAYLDNVTVNPQQSVNVQWYVDNTIRIGGYNLYRSVNNKAGSYSLINFTPFSNQITTSYTDENVNTNSNTYFYYVLVVDTCFNPVLQTDTSNTILLKAAPSANLTATLNWNNYASYLGGVSGYNIYRSVNNAAFNLAATNVQGNTYIDDLSPFAADEGVFLYYVEAIEGAHDQYGFTETSQSNYDTVYMDANLYIPNSFAPAGKNKVFLPIGAYINNTNYSLNIFNRLGEKIFESNDPNTGWNGGGHEEGVYAYTVEYETSIGEFRQRHGTVNLIR